MIGPAIGGWVVSAGAPVAIFTTNTISFLIFSAVITFLKSQGDRPPATRSAQGNWGLAAWREVVSSFGASLLVVFCLFAGIAALIRPVFELLPGFVGDIAKDPEAAPEIFSLLTSAQGLGAMLGAFAISLLLARMKYQNVAMTAALTASLAALVFLASPQFHLSVAAIAVVSGAVLANGIATQVALQTRLPEKVRGRALSIYTMTFRGLPALGALLAGAVGELVPLRVVFALLAVALMCLTGWVFLSSSRRASKDEPDC
jgi:predicted MFS family arabinose efflux permease